jgi:hypothetical protein
MDLANAAFLKLAAAKLPAEHASIAARVVEIVDAEINAVATALTHAATAAAAPKKTRTITLTNRRPVTITEDDWPMIAEASGDSYKGNDGGRHRQASAQGELDTYTLRVRQHADSRVLVYGKFDAASAWTGSEDWAGGELLDERTTGEAPPQPDIAAAIRRVGENGHIPDRVIRDCIADLPAVEI